MLLMRFTELMVFESGMDRHVTGAEERDPKSPSQYRVLPSYFVVRVDVLSRVVNSHRGGCCGALAPGHAAS